MGPAAPAVTAERRKREADPQYPSPRPFGASTPLIHKPNPFPYCLSNGCLPLAYAGYDVYPGAQASLLVGPAEEPAAAERRKREADPQVLLNGAVLPYAAPVASFAPVGAVAHAPVVKSVVESPAEVAHEVTAHTVPVAVGYHGLPYWG